MKVRLVLVVAIAAAVVLSGCAPVASVDMDELQADLEARSRRVPLVDVWVDGCFPDGVRGMATNHANGDVWVWVGVDFLSGTGEVLDHQDSDAMILEIGETQMWRAPQGATAAMQGYARCRVEKGAFPGSQDIVVYEGPVASK